MKNIGLCLNKKSRVFSKFQKICIFFQTDNLCQFLPQDKVYDFSRMNPKELLVKTVAAFGETELKKDHEKWDFKKLNYSGGLNTKRLKTKSILSPNDLKVGFE